MYDRTYWQDHVLSESGKYVVVRTDGGDNVFTITPFGEVMQRAHFRTLYTSTKSRRLWYRMSLLLHCS